MIYKKRLEARLKYMEDDIRTLKFAPDIIYIGREKVDLQDFMNLLVDFLGIELIESSISLRKKGGE